MARLSFRTTAVMIGAIALGSLAFLDAARASMVEINPSLAVALPGSEDAQVRLLSALMGQPDKGPPKAAAMAVARERLRDEPLDGDALNLMAYVSDPTGRSAETRKYADLATQVSKRQIFSQLAMTYGAASANDTVAALDRFDAVLRSRPDAGALFFPRLRPALASPEMRAAIAGLARDDSPWAMDFLLFSSGEPQFSPFVSDVLRRSGTAVPERQRALLGGPLVTRAFEAADYAGARDIVALVPGGSKALFTSPALSERSLDTRYGAASWSLPSSAAGSASATGKGADVGLSVYATGGAHDVVAIKNLLLAPGRYAMSHALVAGMNAAEGADARWRLSCIGRSDIWISPNLLAGEGTKRTFAPFTVPSGCPAQRLELRTDVVFGQPSIDFTVRNLALKRASAAN
ncbi:hypothetical protein [Tsuneonella amylolytica]|uniref:hypothetical protein n=1 Tax=Tsuneonella amylolytica TaxID=2338327 RepID=UPI000EA897D5|nr:hypothetical protein [Tsuneonella amylolytica]